MYAAAFAVVFIKIGLAVAQQRHIEEGRVFIIPFQSMVMQFFDAATYGIGGAAFMAHDWLSILCMGLGAGSGSLVALWVDRNWLKRLLLEDEAAPPLKKKPGLRVVGGKPKP